MQRPVLYSFRRCPYAMRARLALHVAEIDYAHREILLKQKPHAMLKLSPKGTVPVLHLQEGRVLEQSLDIMHWALNQRDPEGWLGIEARQSQELISSNDGAFKHALDKYKYHVRFPEHSQETYRQDAELFLATLEKQLLKHQGLGLVATRISLADMAIMPFVRQFSRVEPEWFATCPYPSLRQWLQGIENSERFAAIMTKHTVWRE